MKLYYFKTKNFGDALNPYLWTRLLPDVLDDDADTLFVGIGTLINDLIPEAPRKVVFGSGAGYGTALPNVHDGRWNFLCVRGPRTAEVLGLDPTLGVMDPAVLLRLLHDTVPPRKRSGVGFMAHYRTEYLGPWRAVADRLGWTYISPVDDIETIVRQISSCEVLVTEALHGAIVASAFRVPYVSWKSRAGILTSKWKDWSATAHTSYTPTEVDELYHPSWVRKQVCKRAPFLPNGLVEKTAAAVLNPFNARRIELNAQRLAAAAARPHDEPRWEASFEAVEGGVRRLEALLEQVRTGAAIS